MTHLPALPSDATIGGLAFHRLLFARLRSAWWTPLLTGLLGLALYVAMLAVVLAAGIVAVLVSPEFGQRVLQLSETIEFDLTDPVMLAVMLGTIVLMLPAYVVAARIVHGPRNGLISAVAGRLRWRWMLTCVAAAAVISIALTALSALLPADAGDAVAPAANPQFLASLVVIVLMVPLQATAEEYVFRGYLQQAVGRWLRHPAFAILLPVPLFVLGHLYDPVGQIGVAAFAIAAGWLTWRTGGLEAAIAVHVVNNLLAFLLALVGLADVNEMSPGVVSLMFSLLLPAIFVAVVEVMMRRGRMGRTLILVIPPEPVREQDAAVVAS